MQLSNDTTHAPSALLKTTFIYDPNGVHFAELFSTQEFLAVPANTDTLPEVARTIDGDPISDAEASLPEIYPDVPWKWLIPADQRQTDRRLFDRELWDMLLADERRRIERERKADAAFQRSVAAYLAELDAMSDDKE